MKFFFATEREQVFIASAKGQNGPKSPYTQEHCIEFYGIFTSTVYRELIRNERKKIILDFR